MSPVETRIKSGEAVQADGEWLAFLDDVFASVSLAGFVSNGMEPMNARRLVELLGMTRRINADLEELR